VALACPFRQNAQMSCQGLLTQSIIFTNAMSTISVDLLIIPEWIIPIEPAGIVLTDHAVVVRNGLIVELCKVSLARSRYLAKNEIVLPGEVLMPGLVNTHCHAAMTLLRGYADDMPLMSWLQERIWPAEAALASAAFVHDGSLLACLEMLRGGTTCFNDMYFFPEQTAAAVQATGMRAALGLVIIDFPTAYASTPDEYFAKGLALLEQYRGDDRLTFCLAPHAPYTVCDDSLRKVAALSDRLNLPIHIHLNETLGEIEAHRAQHQLTPLERLDRLGLVNAKFLGVHAVHMTQADLALITQRNAHLAHCPTSNLKLASGIASLQGWTQYGINFGLGTDGAASNNRLDMWQEMRHASLLAKGISGDATLMDCHRTLRAATIDGARALGLDHRIGSLCAGKAADLVSVSLRDIDLQPLFDPASHLIYSASREDVTQVWVSGQQIIRNRKSSYQDEAALLQRVAIWQEKARALP
jgi:5-methylthioadenosine/S-adenosylhomocysteine deaminase